MRNCKQNRFIKTRATVKVVRADLTGFKVLQVFNNVVSATNNYYKGTIKITQKDEENKTITTKFTEEQFEHLSYIIMQIDKI